MSRARLRLALCSALIAAQANSASALIFDKDDREYVSTSPGSLYAPIGVVTRGLILQYRTTGILVDKCHVLTSRHIFGKTESVIGRRLRFTGALNDYRNHRWSVGVVVAAGDGIPDQKSHWDFAADWLLLRLDRCLGETLGFAVLKDGPFSPYELSVESAGYPDDRDTAIGLSLDPSCVISHLYPTVVTHTCAGRHGNSGGPIFRISRSSGEDRLLVYAIQTTAYTSIWKPVPVTAGWENAATPIYAIIDHIRPYLGPEVRQAAGEGPAMPERQGGMSGKAAGRALSPSTQGSALIDLREVPRPPASNVP